MTLIATPLYAGLLALFYFYLTALVVRQRRKRRVSIGDGEERTLLRAMRVHANFGEYAPFTLLLIGFAELMGTGTLLVHCMGLALVVGRVMHAYGLGQEPDNFKFRQWGMYLTIAAMLVAALFCMFLSARALIVAA